MNRKRSGTGWLLTSLGASALISVVACQGAVGPPATAPSQAEPEPVLTYPLFEDVTAQVGLEHTYRNGEEADHFAILESLGGGVALIDYDGDGLLDIFVTGGGYFDGPDKKEIKGYPCKLYKNLGNWKFQDVTKEVGLDQALFYSHGAAVGDYDRDGWPDLLVTGYGRLALYHNVADPRAPGGRRFVEVTKEAGLLGQHFWSTSAAFADFDGDGYPDLYVCQYVNWSFANHPICRHSPAAPRDVCAPGEFEARPHALYRNNGKGHFVNVSKEAGLRLERADKDYGKGLGVLAVDVNGDGRPDIYVANDRTEKFLYLNRSTPGQMRFDEVGLESGVALDDHSRPNGSMGVDAADYNGTGRPSLWVTNFEGENHGLYRHDGPVAGPGDRVAFQFATQEAGIAARGQPYVGFGTGFFDVQNRGWEDLVISNGHVLRALRRGNGRQPAWVLLNTAGPNGQRQFIEVSAHSGPYFQELHRGRGVAIGDLDNDGFPDLIISHQNEPVVVLRNKSPRGNHWLGVELVGRAHRDVVGAKVTLEVDGRRLTRFAKGGGSYLSANDRRQLFGLGTATRVGRLMVEWPCGGSRTQHWDNLPIDRYWRLIEGEEAARPSSGPLAVTGNKRE
jgi:hypothetical protein